MNNSEFFEREIAHIENEDFRAFVAWFFDTSVGEWFWESGASSSGKYHPVFTQGEGGLVRHTRAAAWVCEELLRLNSFGYMNAEYKDFARMAILLHDTRKYGRNDEPNPNCYVEHGALAAFAVKIAWVDFFKYPCPDLLSMAICSHMGQWTTNSEERPFTTIDRVVHLADYIASRSFWDIPSLCEEYEQDAKRKMMEEPIDFPF